LPPDNLAAKNDSAGASAGAVILFGAVIEFGAVI